MGSRVLYTNSSVTRHGPSRDQDHQAPFKNASRCSALNVQRSAPKTTAIAEYMTCEVS